MIVLDPAGDELQYLFLSTLPLFSILRYPPAALLHTTNPSSTKQFHNNHSQWHLNQSSSRPTEVSSPFSLSDISNSYTPQHQCCQARIGTLELIEVTQSLSPPWSTRLS